MSCLLDNCQRMDSYRDFLFARADETCFQANDDAIKCQMKVGNIFWKILFKVTRSIFPFRDRSHDHG